MEKNWAMILLGWGKLQEQGSEEGSDELGAYLCMSVWVFGWSAREMRDDTVAYLGKGSIVLPPPLPAHHQDDVQGEGAERRRMRLIMIKLLYILHKLRQLRHFFQKKMDKKRIAISNDNLSKNKTKQTKHTRLKQCAEKKNNHTDTHKLGDWGRIRRSFMGYGMGKIRELFSTLPK